MPTTLDFHIRLRENDGFNLDVFERGKTQPLAHSSFDYDLSYMTGFEINQLQADAKDPWERFQRLRDFGAKLYEKVFTPEVQRVWRDFKDKSDFLELRLRLAPEAAGLEALPWETLYDGEEFLAAGATTGLTRLPLDVKIQDDVPELPPPLKMLAFMSSPLDLAENERLQIEQEKEILVQAVNAPAGAGKLRLEFEDEAKMPILESALEEGWHIWHYSGHGIAPEDGGGLLLEDAEGKKRPTGVADLLHALQKGEKTLRLAVISGCQTARTQHAGGFRDLARSLLRRKIPAVIAMQFSITDQGGLLFAKELYPRLLEGQSLARAVSACRRLLLHDDHAPIRGDALAPVLFAANDQPLRLAAAEQTPETTPIKLDKSFYLPLPQLSFGFYGRHKEYRAIRDGLIYRNHRAVIIHGIGGIGKTALISHVAERLKSYFKGVYAFDCSGGGLAPETILLRLHRYLERQGVTTLRDLLHQSFPPEELATFMGQVLGQWPLLLIFDNFENLLAPHSAENRPTTGDASHEIADDNLRAFLKTLVKTTATGTRFVFTSRHLFDIDDKRVGTVQAAPLHDLIRPEALGLMQKLPNLSSASYWDKLRIFEKFGGHPYALVALDRHCSFKPLATTLQDAAQVHAELREFLAIELNYVELSERARNLLNRLAVFRKPVPLAVVEWVLGEKADEDIVARKFFTRPDLNPELRKPGEEEFVERYKTAHPVQRTAENIDRSVRELIGWGLLTPLAEDGEMNALAVHSLVREFCREKLVPKTWREFLLDAAAWYANQTKLMQQDDMTPETVWIDLEVLELLMEAGAYKYAAGILLDAGELMDRWSWEFGRYRESLYYRILPKATKEQQAGLMHNQGILFQDRGDYSSALAFYEKSLKIKEEIGNHADTANSLHQIGAIHQDRGEYNAALVRYEKSLKIFEEIGNRAAAGTSLRSIGAIHQTRGDYGAALAHYKKSLEIFEEIGDRAGVAQSLHQIGRLHQDRGDYSAALAQYEKSLKIKAQIDDRAGVAISLHQIGMIHQNRSDYGAALTQYENSLKIFEEIGARAGVAQSLHQIGIVYHARSDYDPALAQFEKSLKIKEEIGDRAGIAQTLHQIGMVYHARSDYDTALAQYENSLKIAEEIGDCAVMAGSLHQIGTIHMDRGDYDAALAQYEKSLEITEEIGNRAGVAKSLHQIGNIHYFRGDFGAALAQYEKSFKIAKEIGDRAGVAVSLHNIGVIHQNRGDYGTALAQYEKSLEIAKEIDDRAGAAKSLHQIGNIHCLRGDYDAALVQHEKSLEIKEQISDRAGVARSLHQIGMIHHYRGDCDAALVQYEKSLKIKKEIGDRTGAASSNGQIGQLFVQLGRFPEGFEKLLFALAIFMELQSPDGRVAVNFLKDLREKWGAAPFDAAWREKTGEDVPEWLR